MTKQMTMEQMMEAFARTEARMQSQEERIAELTATAATLKAQNEALQREKGRRAEKTGFLDPNPHAGAMGAKGPKPDYYGYCTINGEELRIACWIKERGRMQLQFGSREDVRREAVDEAVERSEAQAREKMKAGLVQAAKRG